MALPLSWMFILIISFPETVSIFTSFKRLDVARADNRQKQKKRFLGRFAMLGVLSKLIVI